MYVIATLSVYPHRASFSNRPDRVAQLAEHWASILKVVGSNPTVARHIFQACPVWIYTQSSNYINLMEVKSRARNQQYVTICTLFL